MPLAHSDRLLRLGVLGCIYVALIVVIFHVLTRCDR